MRNLHPLRTLGSRLRGLFPLATRTAPRAGLIEALEQRIAPAFVVLPANTPETPGAALDPSTGGLTGTVLAFVDAPFVDSAQPVPFASGVLRSLVVDRDPTAGVALDFYYQIVNTSPGPDPLGDADFYRMKTIAGFNAASDPVQVAQTTSLAGLAAGASGINFGSYTQGAGLQAAATADRDVGTVGSVGFNFPPQPPQPFTGHPNDVNFGESSAFLVVRTNATTFGTVQMVVSGSSSSFPATFAPVASPFIVTTTLDAVNVGDGVVSLREAITAANGTPGTDTITFAIPGAGVKTIVPATALPAITEATVIDGYSQAGSSVNTAGTGTNAVLTVVLNAAAQGGGHALVLGGTGGSTVKGLVIQGAASAINDNGHGIAVRSDNNTITGNFIGTDTSGTLDRGNANAQVSVGLFLGADNFSGNRIGGSAPADRNILSGGAYGVQLTDDSFGTQIFGNLIGTDKTGNNAIPNTNTGIAIGGTGTIVGAAGAGNVISGNDGWGINTGGTNTTIQGNLIGVNAAGTAALPNARSGVNFSNGATTALVGGSGAGQGNVISGNAGVGLEIGSGFGDGPGNDITVRGNRIGTDLASTLPLGNAGGGIGVFGTNGATIGGLGAGEGNVIAFNTGAGIFLDEIAGPISGARLSGNSIHGNTGLGIDLGDDAVTANDALDADTGENGLQNFPVLTSATRNATMANVAGTLNSAASADFRIEFFASPAADASGFGEGRTFLGDIGVTTNAGGDVTFNFSPAVLPAAGSFITATATRVSTGDSSEFGAALVLQSPASSFATLPSPTPETPGLVIPAIGAGVLSGTVLRVFDSTFADNAAPAFATGILRSFVVDRDPTAGVALDFYYQLVNTSPGPDPLGDADFYRLKTIGGFSAALVPGVDPVMAGQTTSLAGLSAGTSGIVFATYMQGAGLQSAATADRDEGTPGSIGFSFPVQPPLPFTGDPNDVNFGESGAFLVVRTNAVNYTAVQAVVSGSATSFPVTFAPTALAGPATFTVTTELDVVNGADGVVSLREAILLANASPGADTIAFNIPGGGVKTIAPASALPVIAEAAIIDGYTQPGAARNTNGPGLANNAVLRIELNGAGAGAGVHGLNLDAFSGGSRVSGLAVNRFGGDGIFIQSGGNTIDGNFLGTDIGGDTDLGNLGQGVNISGAVGNIVGGASAGARNVISGNDRSGVAIGGSGASGNMVLGNFLGTDFTGTRDVGNTQAGVFITDSFGNTVGGIAAGNVISGNGFGVAIVGLTATANVVQGNLIGTDTTGAAALGNTLFGVAFASDAHDNTVGGTAAGAGNTIAFTREGVQVGGGAGNAIRGNSIHSNTRLGINLIGGIEDPTDTTANDALDADTGANNLQNFPVITNATATAISGTIASSASTALTLDFYSNPVNENEGRVFLGSAGITTDAGGNFTFSFPPTVTPAPGSFITATATDGGGNTSEFSPARALASVFLWDGSASNSWFDAANWTPAGVPGPADTAILDINGSISIPSDTSVAIFRQSNGFFGSPAGVTFTVLENFEWSGGTQTTGTGTTVIPVGGLLTLSGGSTLNRTMINNGTANSSGGGFGPTVVGGGFTNNGTFNASGSAGISGDFTNAAGGIFNQSSGITTFFNGVFTNSGAVNIIGGTVNLSGTGTHIGGFGLAPAGTLGFTGGAHVLSGALGGTGSVNVTNGTTTLDNTATYNVSGATTVSGGTITFNTALNAAFGTLNESNGLIAGSANLLVNTAFNWTGGAMSGSGATTIAAAATLTLGGLATKTLNRQIFNNGAATWTGGAVNGGSVFTNNSAFTASSGDSFGASFSNTAAATFTQSAGTNTFSGAFTNGGAIDIAAGTLAVNGGFAQTSGFVSLNGGALSTTGTLTFNGGDLRGAGTITGSVNNFSGTVRPGGTGAAGTLAITGTYTQGAAGTLAVELGGTGAGQFDVLNVGGAATLGGTLNIANLGGFTPAGGQSFRVVQSAGNPGAFAALTGATAGLTQSADATGLRLTTAVANTVTGTAGDDTLILQIQTGVAGFTLNGGPFTALAAGPNFTFSGGDGNDTLIIDFAGGNPIPAGGVFYNGENQTATPGDKLSILGGAQGTVTYNYTNAHDGSVVMSNFGTVAYTGLEPISNTGSATDIVFNLPATANTVTLADDGTAGNTLSRLSGANFERTDFANPTGSIAINRGTAADTLTFAALPDFSASLAAGSGVAPFGDVTFSAAVTLGAGKNLTVFSTGNINAGGALGVSGVTTLTTGPTRDITLANAANALGTVVIGGGANVSLRDDGGFDLGAANVSTLLSVQSDGAITQSGVLAGSGGLAKLGVGALLLSGANTFTGTTNLNAGAIQLGHDSALGSAAGGTIVASGATLDVNGRTISEPLSLSGIGGTAAVLTVIDGSVAVSEVQRFTPPATNFSLSFQANTTVLLPPNATAAAVQSALGGLPSIVAAGGVIVIALGPDFQITFNAPGDRPALLLSGGTGALTSSSLLESNLNGTVTLAAATTVNPAAGTIHLTGQVTGAGNLTKIGGGILTFANNTNDFTGTVALNAGTITVTANGGLGATSAGTFISSGELRLQGGLTAAAEPLNFIGGRLNSVSGPNTFAGPIVLNANIQIETFGAGGPGPLTLTGAMSGPFGFTKVGPEVLTLTGAKTYTGLTTVSVGTLGLSGSLAGGATVLAGATLSGAGTISGSVSNSGTIQPGGTGAVGTLTVGGIYTQGAGGTLAVELGGTGAGTFDVLNVSGAATLGGTLNIAHLGGFTPSGGNTFRVVQSAGNPGTFATLNGLSAGKTQTADATGLVLAQAAGGTFIWDAGGGADQSWFNPLNWDLDSGVPGAGDTAILSIASTIDLGATGRTVLNFSQSAGTFTGGATLTITGAFAWTGGAQSGAGATTLPTGSTFTLGTGAAKTLTQRTLDAGGGGTMTAGESFGLASNATLQFSGGTFTMDGGNTFTGSGNVRMTGAGTTLTINGAGASTQGNVRFLAEGGTQNGTGPLSLLGGLTWGATTFSGSGVITSPAFGGSGITVTGGGVLDGRTFNAAQDINVNGGFTLANGAVINSSGFTNLNVTATLASVGSGNAFNNLGTNLGNTAQFRTSGAPVVTVDFPFTNAAQVIVNGGSITFNGGFTQTAGSTQIGGVGGIASSTPMIFNGGELRGTGTITGSVNNVGATVLPGGPGVIGTITITGNYTQGTGGRLLTDLQSVASFDRLIVSGTTTLDGTLDVLFERGFTPAQGNNFRVVQSANNPTTFTTLAGQVTGFTQTADATGLVIAQGGLSFVWDAGGGADTSWFNPLNWVGDSGFPGANDFATLRINATTTLPSDHAVGALFHEGSVNTILSIPAGVTLTVRDSFTWRGGTEAGAGALTVAPGGVFLFPGTAGNNAFLTSRVLNLQGTSTFSNQSSEIISFTLGTINNSGNLEIRSQLTFNQSVGSSGAFNNLAGGTVRIPTFTALITGTSVASTNAGILRAELGTLSFNGGLTQTAGSTQLAGGSIATGGAFQLQGGELTGVGNFGATIFNTGGVVRPGGTGVTGTITTGGNYNQGAGGTIELEVAGVGAGQFDVFAPNGVAILNGTLNAPLLGGFTPAANDTFRVFDPTSNVVNTFATVNSPLIAQYNLGDVTLIVPGGPQTFIWDGGGGADQSWFNPINWNLDSGVPGAIDTAVLQTAQTINLPSDTSVGTFQQSIGTFTSPAGVTFTVLNSFAWTGGTQSGSGTTISSGTLTLSGAGAKTLTTRSFINNGTANLSGGNLTANSAAFTNNGVFNATDDADFLGTGSASFANSATGTLNKTGAGTTSTFYVSTNAGTVNATGGTLTFNNGYTQTAGSTVLGGGSIGGAAGFIFQGGDLRGSGTISPSILSNTGATIRPGGTGAVGTITIAGASGYTQGAGGRVAVEIGGTGAGQFDVLAVTGNAILDGAMDVSLLGGFTPAAANTFQVLTGGSRSGQFQFVNGPLVGQYNPTNVTLISTPGVFNWDAGAGADTSWFNPANWSPDGVPGATDTATLRINATATLPSSTSVGTWIHDVPSGGGNANFFTVAAGATFTVLNNFTWTGGTEDGPGTTTVVPGASFSYPDGRPTFLTQRTLNLQGTGILNSASGNALTLASGATINNSGALDFQSGINISGTGTFNNLAAGTLRKTTSAFGTVIFGNNVAFTNAGTVRAELGTLGINGGYTQTAGSSQMVGGILNIFPSFQLQGGELSGVGAFVGTINNTGGVVRPGGTGTTGTLTTSGSYLQAAGGTIELEVAGVGAGQFDVFAPGGTANINGTLNAPLLGGFTPATTDTFRVFDPNFVNGTFATVNSPLTVQYNAGDVTLLAPTSQIFTWDNSTGNGDWFNALNWDRDSGVPGAADTAILNIASTISLPSSTSVGTFQQSTGTMTGAGAAIFTTLNGYAWSGGSLGVTTNIAAGATLNLSGVDPKTLSGTTLNIQSGATAQWSGSGAIVLRVDAAINNSGTFLAQSSATMVRNDGSFPAFNNLAGGLFSKTGTGTTPIDSAVAFNNAGAVSATTAGAQIDFGKLTVSNGASFAGPGVSRAFGSFGIAGTTTITGGPALELAGGTLSGTGTFGGSGSFNWSSGAITGAVTIASGSTAQISGASAMNLSGSLAIPTGATVQWNGLGNIQLSNNATINNSGTFLAQNSAFLLRADGSSPAFNNLAGGVFSKTGAGTTTVVGSVAFNNAGAVSVSTVGALIEFGTLTTSDGASFAGPGVSRATGNFGITGTTTITGGPALEFVNGNLSGAGTFGGTGNFNWRSGTITGALTIASGSTAQLTGVNDKGLSGSLAIQNGATVEWSGTGDIQTSNNAAINNSGVFLALNSESLFRTDGSVPVFNNLAGGTLRKTTDAGTTTINGMAFHNAGTIAAQIGTLNFTDGYTQTAGETQLIGGTITVGTPLTLAGGVLTGAGTITGSVSNTGATVRPGGTNTPGTLTITGGFTQGAGGTLAFEANGAGVGQFDRVTVGGTATLGGTLNIDFLGAFVPAFGDSFQVVATANNPGTFTQLTGDNAGVAQTASATGLSITRSSLVYIWDGEAGNDWFNPINWDRNSGIPGASDTAILDIASTINLPSAATVSVFNQSNGVFRGGGTLTITSASNWSGGIFNDGGKTVIAAGATLTLSSVAEHFTDMHDFEIAGTVIHSGTGQFRSNNNGDITILPGGLYDLQTDADFFGNFGNGNAALNNQGTFRKSGGSGVTFVNADGATYAFNNTGTIEVQSGTLQFQDSGTHSGTFNVASGALMQFTAAQTFNTGTQFLGTGESQILGGLSFLNGAITTQNLVLAGGGISGTHTLTGTFEWRGGTLGNFFSPGTTTIPAGSTMTLTSATDHVLNAQVLALSGTLLHTGAGNLRGVDSPVVNVLSGGLYDLRSDADFQVNGGDGTMTLNNAGTFRKSVANGTSATGGLPNTVPFNNTGTVEVQSGTLSFSQPFTQTAGATVLNGGSLGGATLNFQGGELRGSGTITGNVSNTGATVRPGGTNAAGAILITGNYTQGAGGTLAIEIGGTGAGQFDRLDVLSTGNLDGTVNATLIGGFTPAPGDAFTVLTHDARNGTFATVSTQGGLTETYSSSSFVLTQTTTLPPTVVNTTLDIVDVEDGLTSLREAILFANSNAGLDTITFNIPGAGVQTITPASALPAITGAVVIDGYSQPGASANTLAIGNDAQLRIALSGTPSLGNGLTISAAGVTVNGLVIGGFNDGIFVAGANAVITGNWIGVSATGTTAAGNADDGIQVNANGALIGGTTPAARNVISGSGERGIELTGGFGAMTVQGNYIGTNAAGTAAIVNGQNGVRIGTNNVNSPNVVIGGTAPGAGNLISGNGIVPGTGAGGIHLQDSSNALVLGNLIGTNAAGTAAIPNLTGVILNTMTNSRIGGVTAAERNVISGNDQGIYLFRGSANTVQGNFIGTDLTGTAAVPNSIGIDFDSATSSNIIGGAVAGARNVISGNTGSGIIVAGTAHRIVGNYIGTNAAGTAALGNLGAGVVLTSAGNFLGGVNAGEGNVISGNGARGVLIFGSGNTVQGNFIGTDATGMFAVKNNFDGLTIAAPGSNNIIGGAAAGARNVISGNDIAGVTIESINPADGFATGNRVQGNFIGLAADGVTRLGNKAGVQLGWGVVILRQATGNLIGGTVAGEGNAVAANDGPGIAIMEGASGNRIEGNFVGTNSAGAAGLGNGGSGIVVDNSPNNRIGDANVPNVVGSSARHGIELTGAGATGNLVQNNFAGLTPATFPGGARAIPNALAGIALLAGASGNDIGGTARGNAIAGNTGDGVLLDNANNNTVRGNRIGHVQLLTQFIPNGGAGVHVIGGTGNRIGSPALSEINGILHNTGAGILVEGNGAIVTARGNIIEGNGGLGIDLGGNGVTANDAQDSDAGPNTLLNFPTLTSVIRTAGGTGYDYTVNGSYNGAPNTNVTIDLYANPAADASGAGEGMFVIHSFSVTTDAGGAAAFTRNFTGPVNAAFFNVPFGDFITAQATLGNGASGPSSEFSPAVSASLFTTRISVLDAAAAEGRSGTNTLTFRVRLNETATAPVTVHFATHDLAQPGAATAGVDYLATQGDVSFAIGETEKTIAIALNGDITPEARERFGLTLSAATGAGLADAEATGAILDDDHHLFFAAQGSGSRVEIRNAKDGELVRGFDAFAPGFKGGVRVASGDVNGDGFNDVIVGTGDGGGARVRVFDGHNVGANGRPVKLHDFYAYGNGYRGGVYVAAGDVNGDGKADIIVSPGAGSSGLVKVFSGADGSLHSSFLAFGRGAGGVRVAAGDINGDGYADIIAGSGAGASVRVFDGLKTGEILSSFRAFPRSYAGGITVASGDVNGDGLDDVIVGAGRGSSIARIFLGGQPGSPLEFAAFGDSTRGINVGAVDLNSDGIADIIAAQARNAVPKIRIYKGNSILNGTPRAPVDVTAFAFDPNFLGGVFVG